MAFRKNAKGILYFTLVALGLAAVGFGSSTGGPNSFLTERDGTSGIGIHRNVITDVNGTPVGTATVATATPMATATPLPNQSDGTNSALLAAPPQENITAINTYTLASNVVTVVNITTTVGTVCPMGASWWLGTSSAAIYWVYGNLTFTPSTGQLANYYQLASGTLPPVSPYPAYAGSKIYMCGQTGAATISIGTGEFKNK